MGGILVTKNQILSELKSVELPETLRAIGARPTLPKLLERILDFDVFDWGIDWGTHTYMGIFHDYDGTDILELTHIGEPGYLLIPAGVTGKQLKEWMETYPVVIAKFFTDWEKTPEFEKAWDSLCKYEEGYVNH